MVKAGVNGFGCIGCLVTRAAINSGKVGVVAIIFTDLNYMVYMFWYGSTHDKFHSTIKAENGKLVINGKAISIFPSGVLHRCCWCQVCGGVHWYLHYHGEAGLT